MRRRTALLVPAALASTLPLLAACDPSGLPFLPAGTVSGSDTITLVRSEASVGGTGPTTVFTVTAQELSRTVEAPDGSLLAEVSFDISAAQRAAIEEATQTYIDRAGSDDEDDICTDSGRHSVIVSGDLEYQSSRMDCAEPGPSPADIMDALRDQTRDSLPPVARPDLRWTAELRHDQDTGQMMTIEGGSRNESFLGDHQVSVTIQDGGTQEVSLSAEDTLTLLRSMNDALSETPEACQDSPRTLIISLPEEDSLRAPADVTIRLCGSSAATEVASHMERLR